MKTCRRLGVLTLAAAVAALTAGCVATAQTVPERAPGERIITVSAAQVAKCRQEGGCHLLTREEMVRLAVEGYDLGQSDVDCRRPRL